MTDYINSSKEFFYIPASNFSKIEAFIDATEPLDDLLSDSKLIENGYEQLVIGQTIWYMHKGLSKFGGGWGISRFAMFRNIYNLKNKRTDKDISHFIFTKDKSANILARGIKPDEFDRFDAFRCAYEVGNYRKSGTLKGPVARTQAHRDINKEFLQILMYGNFNISKKLTCAYDGSVVENVKTFDDYVGIEKYIDIFELHHAYFLEGTSVEKSDSPSAYLNKDKFHNFPNSVIVEFLSCIVLSLNSHGRIHKAQRCDDIAGWIKKFNRGELSYLPHHWLSEENYNSTLQILEDSCYKFDAAAAPTYSEFIGKNLLNPLNVVSPILDSSQPTKTDPSSQTPILYTEENV